MVTAVTCVGTEIFDSDALSPEVTTTPSVSYSQSDDSVEQAERTVHPNQTDWVSKLPAITRLGSPKILVRETGMLCSFEALDACPV
jgi:hypothetical protein